MLQLIWLLLNCTSYFWRLFLSTCVSPACTKFSPSSINCNIVFKCILQTQPRWMHERDAMLMILPYSPLTLLQHPNTTEYHQHMCVLAADIPLMEIPISPLLTTNSVWTLTTQLSLTRFQIYRVLQILNTVTIICHAVTSNAKISCIITVYSGVICWGTCSHSGSQCSILPAPRVSYYWKAS